MEQNQGSVAVTVDSLKAELVKRTAELVTNYVVIRNIQKKTKTEFKNLHAVAKKLREKLVCSSFVYLLIQDVAEAEIKALKESRSQTVSSMGLTEDNPSLESEVQENKLYS